MGNSLLENARLLLFGFFQYLTVEANGLVTLSLFNNAVKTFKCTAADEENVGGVDLNKILVGVLSSALWRNVGNRALKDL